MCQVCTAPLKVVAVLLQGLQLLLLVPGHLGQLWGCMGKTQSLLDLCVLTLAVGCNPKCSVCVASHTLGFACAVLS